MSSAIHAATPFTSAFEANNATIASDKTSLEQICTPGYSKLPPSVLWMASEQRSSEELCSSSGRLAASRVTSICWRNRRVHLYACQPIASCMLVALFGKIYDIYALLYVYISRVIPVTEIVASIRCGNAVAVFVKKSNERTKSDFILQWLPP